MNNLTFEKNIKIKKDQYEMTSNGGNTHQRKVIMEWEDDDTRMYLKSLGHFKNIPNDVINYYWFDLLNDIQKYSKM